MSMFVQQALPKAFGYNPNHSIENTEGMESFIDDEQGKNRKYPAAAIQEAALSNPEKGNFVLHNSLLALPL